MSNLKARAQSSSSRRESFAANQSSLKQAPTSNAEKMKNVLKENIHTTGKKKFHFSGKCLSKIQKAKEPLHDNSNSTFRSEETLGGKSELSQLLNPSKESEGRSALTNGIDWDRSNTKTSSKSGGCDQSLLDIVLSAKQGTLNAYSGNLITPNKSDQNLHTPLRPIEEENISNAAKIGSKLVQNHDNVQSLDFMGSLNNSFSPNVQQIISTNGFLDNTAFESGQKSCSKEELNSAENPLCLLAQNSYSKMVSENNRNNEKIRGTRILKCSQESMPPFSHLPTPGDSSFPLGKIPPLLSTVHHARIQSMKSMNQRIRRNLELSDFNKEGCYPNNFYSNLQPSNLFAEAVDGGSDASDLRRYMELRFSHIEKRLDANENLVKLSEEILVLKREAEAKAPQTQSEEKKWNDILGKLSGLDKRISCLELALSRSLVQEDTMHNYKEISDKFELFTQKILQSLLSFSEKLKELNRRQQLRKNEKDDTITYIKTVEKDLEMRIKAVLEENVAILKFEFEQQGSGITENLKNMYEKQSAFENSLNEKCNAMRRLEDDFFRILDDNLKLHEKINALKFHINDQKQTNTNLTKKLMNINEKN